MYWDGYSSNARERLVEVNHTLEHVGITPDDIELLADKADNDHIRLAREIATNFQNRALRQLAGHRLENRDYFLSDSHDLEFEPRLQPPIPDRVVGALALLWYQQVTFELA
ncbi:hypothetical protein BH23PAT2_BH23PAT2_09510 [soil metagenome]